MHGGAPQSFPGLTDDVALFCNLIGRGEILPRGTKMVYNNIIRVSPDSVLLLRVRLKEAGHETICHSVCDHCILVKYMYANVESFTRVYRRKRLE